MYAGFDRSRTVHGFDPLKFNIQMATSSYAADAPNLRLHVGGLGERETVYDAGAGKYRGQMVISTRRAATPMPASNTSFQIYTLDGLFAAGGLFADERLGFAHIDVEGFELNVMRGAAVVLRRDRPLVAVEAHVHANLSYTRELLGELAASGYETYLVEEVCGGRADCRNILAFPKSRHAEFAGSPTLMQALASLALLPADAANVGTLAYPCCVRGGECCELKLGARCCTPYTALEWLKRQVNPPPYSRRGWVEPALPF
jgi:FkbM family methyltransferase